VLKLNQEPIRELKEDFNIWYKSKSESFLYINERSRVFERWLSYEEVLKDNKFNNSILKPINMYAKYLYPGPKLLNIENNIVTLQQCNHAEFFLLEDENGFYNIDRPWVRQYYLSDLDCKIPDNCFPGTFRFYIPWLIDENLSVDILQPINSAFQIHEKTINFYKTEQNLKKFDPGFVHFHFKNIGSHLVEPGFAKIPKNTPMFNMRFFANDIIVEKIRKYYEQD
jgi:hypothetical protein